MARLDQLPVIPSRVSSVNVQTTESLTRKPSREDVDKYGRESKIHKILGETPQHGPNVWDGGGEREERLEYPMRGSNTKPARKKEVAFGVFPRPAVPTGILPPQNLRVRASSPLLGQAYQSYDRTVPPVPQKQVHPAGLLSAGSHREFFKSQTLSTSAIKHQDATPNFSQQLQPPDPFLNHKGSKASLKESKRKKRLSRIDLSLLFPKPKGVEEPLLSPQRLTNSPSPVSMFSEYPALHSKRSDGQLAGKKLTKSPSGAKVTTRKHSKTIANPVPERPRIPLSNQLDWFNGEFEKTVRCSEIDRALVQLDIVNDGPQPCSLVPSSYSDPHLNQSKDLPGNIPSSNDLTLKDLWCNLPNESRSEHTHMSQRAGAHTLRGRSVLEETGQGGRRLSGNQKQRLSKKSSKSTLTNCDLYTSSVLCLSSSDDESDREKQPKASRGHRGNTSRDSVTTDDGIEICTAEAVPATRVPNLRHFDRRLSSNTGSHRTSRDQSIGRVPSVFSTARSSYSDYKNQSRPSSAIPTIPEPDMASTERRARIPPTASEAQRRSRIIAVTRQEEYLLEAMRQRQGKITPSLYHEASCRTPDAERGSMVSVPSRDRDLRFVSDMSFLRLSGTLSPTSLLIRDQETPNLDKDGSNFLAAPSDIEQTSINSTASPRASLVYTESASSPSASGISPMTPPLPGHRFSLRSQVPPPRRAPPAVPQEQTRHSRRRTDSSEAIVLDESDEPKTEFPEWAYEWAQAKIGTVH